AAARFAVDPPLAALDEFEVLYRVGQIHALALDSCAPHGVFENFTGRTDERATLHVFHVARLLADEHQLRRRRTLAKNRLRGVAMQLAPLALRRGVAESFVRERAGEIIGGRPPDFRR